MTLPPFCRGSQEPALRMPPVMLTRASTRVSSAKVALASTASVASTVSSTRATRPRPRPRPATQVPHFYTTRLFTNDKMRSAGVWSGNALERWHNVISTNIRLVNEARHIVNGAELYAADPSLGVHV
eukprot:1236993-Pleurochrysis_carterae.AAC.1